MTDFYSQIEAALLDVLKAEPELLGIKTWESEIREALYTGTALSKGFRAEELPAVMVTAIAEPARSKPFSHGEIRYAIPAQVMLVVKAHKKAAAREAATSLLRPIEAAIHRLRTSNSALGANTFVFEDVVSSIAVVEDRPFCYAVAMVTAEIHKVVQL